MQGYKKHAQYTKNAFNKQKKIIATCKKNPLIN